MYRSRSTVDLFLLVQAFFEHMCMSPQGHVHVLKLTFTGPLRFPGHPDADQEVQNIQIKPEKEHASLFVVSIQVRNWQNLGRVV